ncbi:MAG TPA: hypothetical protein VNU01_07055, partial [Egibacteraceae bacterium]|nr:hypothetical protein [Egibacteraceae bacterium]
MGTADTVVDLAELAVSGLPVGGVSVGEVRSFASTDTDPTYNPVGKGKPFAIAKVSLPDGSGQSVRSDGDTGAEGKTVPISGVGSLTVGDLTATAGQDAARSVVNAVEGQLDAVVAGLKARAAGVSAKVGADGSSTTNGAVIEHFSVGLTDVLPADLLAQLPLDKLIALADGLGIKVDLGPLNDAVDQVRELAAAVDEVVGTEKAIEDLETQIDVLRATMGSGTAAAQSAVDQAQAGVDAAQGELDSLNSEHASLVSQYASAGCTTLPALPGCSDIAAQIAAVEQEIAAQEGVVAAKQQVLSEAQAALTVAREGAQTVQAEIDALQAEVDALVASIDDLLDTIVDLAKKVVKLDLEGILEALLAGLDGVELIGVDRMSFGVSTMATATSSKATTLCDVAGVRILGRARQVADCDDVQAAVGEVEATLKGVLAALPIQGVVPANAVNVEGPRMSTSPEDYAAEGYRVASAKVSGLDLTVEPIKLTQVVDSLVVQARALVSGTLDKIKEVTGVEVPVDVNAALDDLLAQLNGLPIGDTLDGVTTPRVAISAIDLGSRSSFRAAGTGIDGHPVDGSPVTPAGDLPHTG